MAFYNKYSNRKDWRKHYQDSDSRSVDSSCQNHGDCPWCIRKREYKNKKREPIEVPVHKSYCIYSYEYDNDYYRHFEHDDYFDYYWWDEWKQANGGCRSNVAGLK